MSLGKPGWTGRTCTVANESISWAQSRLQSWSVRPDGKVYRVISRMRSLLCGLSEQQRADVKRELPSRPPPVSLRTAHPCASDVRDLGRSESLTRQTVVHHPQGSMRREPSTGRNFHGRTRTHTRTHAHMHAHARTCTRARTHTRTRAHAQTRPRTHAQTHVHSHAHAHTQRITPLCALRPHVAGCCSSIHFLSDWHYLSDTRPTAPRPTFLLPRHRISFVSF